MSEVLTDSKGNIAHAEMTHGDGVVMIGNEWTDWAKSPASIGGKNTQRIHVRLEKDIDKHCEHARKSGAFILMEPADQFYGDRTYSARDLEGHYWTFSQAVKYVTTRRHGEGERARRSSRCERSPMSDSASRERASLDRTLAALADPYRRRVVDLLRERPRRAGELADAAELSFPAMSRHLRTLRESGLVEEARDEFDSRVRVYRLRPEPMTELRSWLRGDRATLEPPAASRSRNTSRRASDDVEGARSRCACPADPLRTFEVFTQEIALWWQPDDAVPDHAAGRRQARVRSGRRRPALHDPAGWQRVRDRPHLGVGAWQAAGVRLAPGQLHGGAVHRSRSDSSKPSARKPGSRSSIARGTRFLSVMSPVMGSPNPPPCATSRAGGAARSAHSLAI